MGTHVFNQSHGQQRRKHEPIGEWLAFVAFDPQSEMKDRKRWCQIGEAMELLPPDVTEASEGGICRCRG
jgi:hypothetical protein